MTSIDLDNIDNITYTVHEGNFHKRIPSNVTNVIISDDLDQSLYQQIFKSNSNDGPKFNVSLPPSIEHIHDAAFMYCDTIKSITIPPSVTKIGFKAFQCCNNLRVVHLSENLQEIGDYAFMQCPSLEEMVVNNKYSKNTTVTIPSSVTRIGHGAFAVCFHIQHVKLSKNLHLIHDWAFRGCVKLKEIEFSDDCKVTGIPDEAFGYCHSLQDVKLPKSLEFIGKEAFKFCYSLQSITIPDSVSSIQQRAFEGCIKLVFITLPPYLREIQEYAFSQCYSLTSLIVPDALSTTIERRAFYRCEQLQDIDVPITCTLSDDAFTYVIHSKNYDEQIPDNVNDIIISDDLDQSLFTDFLRTSASKTSHTLNVILSESIQEIQDKAFLNCDSIQSITIPSGITKIGFRAFRNCKSLQRVDFDDRGLQKLQLVIGDEAFRNCTSLRFADIPHSALSQVGKRVFFKCKLLGLTKNMEMSSEDLVQVTSLTKRVFCCL